MMCLDENDLAGEPWAPEELSSEREAHLDSCPGCRQLLTEWIRLQHAPEPDEEAQPPLLGRGSVLGRYTILEVVGSGTTGVVYSAYDSTLDRKVALKLLRGAGGGEEGPGTAFLLREAQAMARLSHPNVITVHDFGTSGDLVFIAMEFVEGGTLADWSGPGTSWRQTLDLFLQAGRGLAAAHHEGLVHRDFKPSNALVGRDGRVRISDLGLVRYTAPPGSLGQSGAAGALHASHAGERGLVGTPAYMAPEQLRGEKASAASDQFAFCVALFEALYGARPFEGHTREELAANLEAGRVRGELEQTEVPGRVRRALLRGLSPRAEDRFPSLPGLLDELAQVASPRRRWVISAGLALVALGALAGGAALLRHRAALCSGAEARLEGVWGEGQKAALERAFLATGKPFAQQAGQTAARILDDYAARWAAGSRDACVATRVRGEQTEALLQLRMVCLDERFSRFAALAQAFQEATPDVVEHAVQAAGLLPELDACASLTGLSAVAAPSDPETAQAAAELQRQVAAAEPLRDLGQYARGLAVVGPLAQRATALGYAPLEARAQLLLGELRQGAGELGKAESALGMAVLRGLAGRDFEAVSRAWIALARLVGHDLARPDEGIALAALAAASLDGHEGGPLLRARLASSLGLALEAKGRSDDALAQHRRALALRESALGPDHWEVGASLNNIGIALQKKGLLAEALASFTRARDLYARALGEHHPLVAGATGNLGLALQALGRYEESAARHAQALAIREATLGPDHPAVAATLNNLGRALQSLGREDEAIGAYQRAISILERTLGREHPNLAPPLTNLGVLLDARGRPGEALAAHRRALAISEKALGPDHPRVAEALVNLGEHERLQGHHREAVAHYERALAIDEKSLGPDHPDLADELQGLGASLLALGAGPRAVGVLERALRLRGKSPGPALAQSRASLARALWSTGRDRKRALALARQAREVLAVSKDAESVRGLEELDRWLMGKVAR